MSKSNLSPERDLVRVVAPYGRAFTSVAPARHRDAALYNHLCFCVMGRRFTTPLPIRGICQRFGVRVCGLRMAKRETKTPHLGCGEIKAAKRQAYAPDCFCSSSIRPISLLSLLMPHP